MDHKHVRLLAAVALLCFGRDGWGQGPEVDSLKGEVHVDSPAAFRNGVTLSDLQNHRTFGSADLQGDGTFEFRHVPYGEYRLTVMENGDRPIFEELVSVRDQACPIVVQVPHREIASPPAGPVSVAQLLHPPAKKAFAAFMAARKFADARQFDKAAEALEKAVRISPAFADAWINLAAQHIRMGRYEQALGELSRAAEIAQPTPLILGNMAFAQNALNRCNEAIHSARQALQLDPSYAPAHYLLGLFLAVDRHTLPESVRHLELAARTIPTAQVPLEQARRDLATAAVTHP